MKRNRQIWNLVVLSLAFAICEASHGKAALVIIEQVFDQVHSPFIFIAPSESQISFSFRHRTELFKLDKEQGHWVKHEIGIGFAGSESSRIEVTHLAPGWSGWVVSANREVFLPHRESEEGYTADSDKLEVLPAGMHLRSTHSDPLSWVARNPWAESFEELKAREHAAYQALKAHAQVIRQQRGAELVSPLPESLESFQADPFIIALQDVAPAKDRILVARKDYEPPISLNLVTGERISFPLAKSGRSQPRFQTGRFSPDGQYVLVLFEHGPDDNEGGGFLQLFRADGAFVEEIGEMPPEGFSPRGFHDWLSNGWILFCDGEQLHFARIQE